VKQAQAGFTLMELLLVVIIVSALAALVWPELARFSRSLAVRTAARDLVGVMARARLEALSRREPVEVRFRASSVTVVRPQPRLTESESSAQAGSASSASSASAGGLGGSLTQESEEVTVLEYPLGKSVAWSRLQVLPEKRDVIRQEQQLGLGQGLSSASSEEEAVTVTFYPDGTSDDALIGLGERQQGGAYGATPASAAPALTDSGEAATEYVVRVRGLVARATVLRTVEGSDEDYFAEVPDVVASLAD